MTDNNKIPEQPKIVTFNAFNQQEQPKINNFNAFNQQEQVKFNTFNLNQNPLLKNDNNLNNPISQFPIFNSVSQPQPRPQIQLPPEPPRPLTRQEILENEITESIRDLILVFQKCKIRTDDVNNEKERAKMMKIIEVYYDSCNSQIVQLALAEIYKGIKKEPFVYKIKFEEMDFDVPDFTYVCFHKYVKKQFEKMQYYINKYY